MWVITIHYRTGRVRSVEKETLADAYAYMNINYDGGVAFFTISPPEFAEEPVT